MNRLPADTSTIRLSDVRSTFGGSNTVRLSNCIPSSTALVRTLDVTSQSPGTVCSLAFNGTDADSIGGFFTGNAATKIWNNGNVSPTLPYTSGLQLPKGSMAFDGTSNPATDDINLNKIKVACEYTISPAFNFLGNGATVTCWFNCKTPVWSGAGGGHIWNLVSDQVKYWQFQTYVSPSSQPGPYQAVIKDVLVRSGLLQNTWYFSAYVISPGNVAANTNQSVAYIGKDGDASIGTPVTIGTHQYGPWNNLTVSRYSRAIASVTYGPFCGFIQDLLIFNRALSVTELTALFLKRGKLNLSSFYYKWSDPSALVSFHNSHVDMVNKGFLTPSSIVVNGSVATNLVYAPHTLKLMQGNLGANLQSNSLDALAAPLTYVTYSVASPYIGAPSSLMFWAKMPSAALTNASNATAATILTLSHGLNTDEDVRVRVYVTTQGGTSHQVTADFYPGGTGSSSVSGLAFDTWYCFGLSLLDTPPWSVKLYYATAAQNTFTYAGSDASAPGTTTAFTEVLVGRQYFTNTGGFPGQIANFRVFPQMSTFTIDPNGAVASDFAIQALNRLA